MKALEIPKELIEKHLGYIKQIPLTAALVECNRQSHCSNLIVVATGSVKVFMQSPDGRTLTLYRVQAGECCCLTVACIMNNTPYPAVMAVEERGSAYVISADCVRKWINDYQEWQSYLFQQLASKITQFTHLTDSLAFNSIDSRIAHVLCDCGQQRKIVRTTHQSLANEVGTSREVVSRSLGHLESQGLVELARGQVKIIDLEGLQDYPSLH